MLRAVFLDRDGTLSEEMGYVNHIDRFHLYPWSAAGIRKLNDARLPVVVITNQSGVARGYFPETLVHEVHAKMRSELAAAAGARIDAIYYCPHHPDAGSGQYRQKCECRKPGIGMLTQASRDLGLDLAYCYVVGDRYLDLKTAFRARAKAILVKSGYGKGEHLYLRDTWDRQPDHVAEDLSDAVDFILKDISRSAG